MLACGICVAVKTALFLQPWDLSADFDAGRLLSADRTKQATSIRGIPARLWVHSPVCHALSAQQTQGLSLYLRAAWH